MAAQKQNSKQEHFEKHLKTLESVIATLEEGDCSLDEMLKNFEKGSNLVVKCREILENAELLVSKVEEKLLKKEEVEF